MKRPAIAGVIWLLAAAFAIAVTITFRTDAVQWVVTVALAVVAAILGLWLMARPSAGVVSASTIVAVVWTVLYLVLAVQQANEVAAWTTDAALIAVGAAAGAAAYRAASRRPTESG